VSDVFGIFRLDLKTFENSINLVEKCKRPLLEAGPDGVTLEARRVAAQVVEGGGGGGGLRGGGRQATQNNKTQPLHDAHTHETLG